MNQLQPAGESPRNTATAINQLIQGRSNATGTVTLTAGTTSTTIENDIFNENAQVFLSARTLNAAGAIATTYATVTAAGTVTITHANTGTTDRTFGYLVIGG